MVYYCFTHIKHMIEQLLKTTKNTSEITTDLPLPVEKARQGARVWSSNPCEKVVLGTLGTYGLGGTPGRFRMVNYQHWDIIEILVMDHE